MVEAYSRQLVYYLFDTNLHKMNAWSKHLQGSWCTIYLIQIYTKRMHVRSTFKAIGALFIRYKSIQNGRMVEAHCDHCRGHSLGRVYYSTFIV